MAPPLAAVTELTQPGVRAVTTTTSTTLLPQLPCLSDTINGLTTRTWPAPAVGTRCRPASFPAPRRRDEPQRRAR